MGWMRQSRQISQPVARRIFQQIFKRIAAWVWTIAVALAIVLLGHTDRWLAQTSPSTPAPPTPTPTTPAPTASPTTPSLPALAPPLVSPSPLPAPPAPPAPAPASTAPPLPLSGEYQDPAGRFKIGIVQGYRVSPLAGSVLIESADGELAYSAIAQSQPSQVVGGFGLTGDALARAATIVFQRGEGFQPGLSQPEAGGGIVMNWTGNLTIAGKTQPMGGIILARSSPKTVLFVLVAATQSGSSQVPSAVSAIANSLQLQS